MTRTDTVNCVHSYTAWLPHPLCSYDYLQCIDNLGGSSTLVERTTPSGTQHCCNNQMAMNIVFPGGLVDPGVIQQVAAHTLTCQSNAYVSSKVFIAMSRQCTQAICSAGHVADIVPHTCTAVPAVLTTLVCHCETYSVVQTQRCYSVSTVVKCLIATGVAADRLMTLGHS